MAAAPDVRAQGGETESGGQPAEETQVPVDPDEDTVDWSEEAEEGEPDEERPVGAVV